MSSTSHLGRRRKWAWTEGHVDEREDFIELRYGSASQFSCDEWLTVARVGAPVEHTFPVEWLLDRKKHPKPVAAIQKELDFYLVEKEEENPWLYAQYHCGTSANLYSDVHWGFHEGSQTAKRRTDEP